MDYKLTFVRSLITGGSYHRHCAVLYVSACHRNLSDAPTDNMSVFYAIIRVAHSELLATEISFAFPITDDHLGSLGIYDERRIQSLVKELAHIGDTNSSVIYEQPEYIECASDSALNEREQTHGELWIAEIKVIASGRLQLTKNKWVADIDGAEVPGACIPPRDRLFDTTSNMIIDAYGGPIMNCTRFWLDFANLIAGAGEAEHGGFRMPSWNIRNEARLHLSRYYPMEYPTRTYVHSSEPPSVCSSKAKNGSTRTCYPISTTWHVPFPPECGHNTCAQMAPKATDKAEYFASSYVSNTCLIQRQTNGAELNIRNRNTFYTDVYNGSKIYAALNRLIIGALIFLKITCI